MTTANQEIKELRQEVEQLTTKLKEKAKDAANGNGIAHLTHFDRKEIRRAARKAGKDVRHFLSDTSKRAVEARDDCEEAIVAHPFRAVAAAVAGGIVLSALFRRK